MIKQFVFVSTVLWASVAQAEETKNPWDGWTFNVQAENDMFGSDADRHYTHGTRFSVATPEGEVADWLKEGASYFPLFSDKGRLRASYALGQNLYTPSDITVSDPAQMDRPYAGWLYGSFGLVSDMESRVDSLELAVGVVGPAALGEQTQKYVHEIVGSPEPQGWDYQLKNEPGVVLTYERKWRRFLEFNTGIYGLEVDASPSVGLSLGNVLTQAELGTMFRFGHDLKHDRGGPPRIRPSLPGSDYYDTSDEFGWYLFGGVAGRYVVRNIFLDGNTFADGASVDKNPMVADFQVGFAVRWHDMRIGYTKIFRTKEYKNQRLPDRFGAITLSYQF